MKHLALILPWALVAACSSEPAPPVADATDAVASEPVASGAPATAMSSPTPTVEPTATADVLGLEGLGDLRIGQPVPAGSTWAMDGAQESDTCLTISSPAYPGVYAIVEDGKVRRITLGGRSTMKLAEGIGVGSSEKEARGWFPFPTTPHEYEDAPAKYLTAPNAASGEPALRLEIGGDGRVSAIHVGTMPILEYVEGCA